MTASILSAKDEESLEKTVTTKELAETLGVSTDSVQNVVKKLGENFRRVLKRNRQCGYLLPRNRRLQSRLNCRTIQRLRRTVSTLFQFQTTLKCLLSRKNLTLTKTSGLRSWKRKTRSSCPTPKVGVPLQKRAETTA